MKKFAMLSAALIFVAVLGCSTKQQATPPGEGKPAPDFTLKNLSGESVALADHRGKVVLVNFWATWCPPCREEIPSMVKLNNAMAGKPFQMLAISIDDGGKQDVEQFFKKMETTLPTLLDPGQEIGRKYGITGVPETFVVDQKGVVIKKVIGPIDWSHPDVLAFLDQAIKSGAPAQQ